LGEDSTHIDANLDDEDESTARGSRNCLWNITVPPSRLDMNRRISSYVLDMSIRKKRGIGSNFMLAGEQEKVNLIIYRQG
jgi:hypothetical protein